jgi:hypothetical protein
MEVEIEFENGTVEYRLNVQRADEIEEGDVVVVYYPEVDKEKEKLKNANIKSAKRELGYN